MKHLKCEKITPRPFTKWIKRLSLVVMVFGFIFALGTAGVSDHETLPFNEIVIRMLIAASLILIGRLGYEVIDHGAREKF